MIHARPDYEAIQDPRGLIPEDEPVFLLRAQDVCAPATLDRWIDFARISGVDPDMIERVIQLRRVMMLWQQKRKVKIPDMPV